MNYQIVSISLPKEVAYVLNKYSNKSETVSKALMHYFGYLVHKKIENTEVTKSVKNFQKRNNLPKHQFTATELITAKNHGRA